MSTILKALDRLERDRDGQQGEMPLRDQVAREPEPGRSSSLKLFAFIAICGGATGAVVAALVMGDGGGLSPDVAVVSPVASAPRAATAPSPEVRRSSAWPPAVESAERQARPAPESSADRGSSPALASRGTASGVDLDVDVASRGPSPGPEAPSNVVYGSADLPPAALQSEVALVDRPVAPPVPEPEPVRMAAPVPRPERAAAAPRREVRPAREVQLERSPQPVVKAEPRPSRATPDVRVARTVWHPTPSRRYALVGVAGAEEPIRVREGDTVGSAVVSEIDPAGVVFLRDEVEFYRRVSAER